MPDNSSLDTETDKPMRADARRNRARLLDVAEEVFAAEGLAASTETIARRAGVGTGTLFRHFPTKDALLSAIVLARVQRLAAAADDHLANDDPAAFTAFFAHMAEEIATKKAFTDLLAEDSREAAIADPDLVRHLRQTIGLLLARAQDAGAVRDDVQLPEIMALIVGAAHAVEHAGPDHDRRERILAIILDGLRAKVRR